MILKLDKNPETYESHTSTVLTCQYCLEEKCINATGKQILSFEKTGTDIIVL